MSTCLTLRSRVRSPVASIAWVNDRWNDDEFGFDPDALPRVLSRDQAVDRGYSRHAIDRRVASGRWRRVLPHTYLTSDIFTWPDRLEAALAFAGPGTLLSGAAALSASGVRAARRPSTILVLAPPSSRVRSGGFVAVRATSRVPDRDPWPGPARAAVPRSAADHALTLRRIDDVRAVVAEVVREHKASLEELAAELRAGPRRGSALLRQALAEIAAGAASAPEAKAARLLRRAQLPEFEQNARIGLPDGSWYVADLYWRELRAILEIDSREYHFSPAGWRATMDRHLVLTTLGYSVVHRPPSALADPAMFIRDISAWLTGRAAARRTA